MQNIKQLIHKHSTQARKSMQGEAGSRIARFNAYMAVNLNQMAERGNTVVSDAVYAQVVNNAHDFINNIRGRHYG